MLACGGAHDQYASLHANKNAWEYPMSWRLQQSSWLGLGISPGTSALPGHGMGSTESLLSKHKDVMEDRYRNRCRDLRTSVELK